MNAKHNLIYFKSSLKNVKKRNHFHLDFRTNIHAAYFTINNNAINNTPFLAFESSHEPFPSEEPALGGIMLNFIFPPLFTFWTIRAPASLLAFSTALNTFSTPGSLASVP